MLTRATFLLLAALIWATIGLAQTKSDNGTTRENLQGDLVDEGPGKLTPLARAPGDASDAADMTNLLDRRTEAAIKRGLDALKKTQRSDGHWGREEDKNREAYTAFAMIAFMMNGHFPNEKPPYGETMTKAVNALLRAGKKQFRGYMGENMYAHGLCTVALSEVWGHTEKDDAVREGLKAAVKVILGAQNSGGGWRYNPIPAGHDVSVTAMQVVALASARQAGIFVPDDTVNRGVRYLTLAHQSSDGGFAYMPGPGLSGFPRTAAACTSMMMLGRHNAPEVKAGLEYLRKEAATALKSLKLMNMGEHWSYGMYYMTIAMNLSGPDNLKWWYPQVRDVLLPLQKADGTFGTRYEHDTPIALIVLSMPYGFVPTYQR
jgi:hypothetical protein